MNAACTAPEWVRHEGLRQWVAELASRAQPTNVLWCDGSQAEYERLCEELVAKGTFIRLNAALRPKFLPGVYGSGAVCDSLKRSRLAEYTWLSNSTAWAGSSSFADWNIRQGRPFAQLGFNHDSNEARDDYGGFRLAGL